MSKPGFNIQDFKTYFAKGGFTKPNKFLARFPVPLGMPNYSNLVKDMEYWCESSNLPGVMLATYDANRYSYGPREKRPITPVFQDTAFTFFADGAKVNGARNPTLNSNYDFFTSWIRLINNFDKSRGIIGPGKDSLLRNPMTYEVAYKIDYLVDMHIATFDDAGNESHHVVLRDAFPIMVSDIRLNWADNSGVMRIPVIITYTDWYLDTAYETGGGAADPLPEATTLPVEEGGLLPPANGSNARPSLIQNPSNSGVRAPSDHDYRLGPPEGGPAVTVFYPRPRTRLNLGGARWADNFDQ